MPAVLNSNELYSLGSGVNVCCNDAIKAYNEGKRDKLHPKDNKTNIDKLESCVAAVSSGAESHCTEQYGALKSCLTDNKNSWVNCMDIRRNLDLCLVKNKLGELSS
uniref:IMS import disulfide relay-system CHCH-CHCH-like Cx9C domain-containing protein n=1 Tax=Chaetoceros debilis TaxID=122233 RepID=A0A7S3QIS4_9STRA|mmetsp:Transcript_14015/g.20935  ORF Transcript_14015/g.20935 Transcript_14015/m.20935 type:complete len:106 (+) Transcript_14015:110-427(+)